MLYLYTEDFFWQSRCKNFFKKILKKNQRGPLAVSQSLLNGFAELGAGCALNQTSQKPIETAGVLSGTKTLRWAIGQKKKGLIRKIIAGPNIVINPNDEGGILLDSMIDKVLAPSAWVKEYYTIAAPGLFNKICIWPAGLDLPAEKNSNKDFDFLVYNKIGRNDMFLSVVQFLKQNNYSYSVLEYGKFKQEEYFKLLEKSKFEIYLSNSESQGLAMFEAWVRNVPTFIYERGCYENGNIKILGNVSAPYLSEAAGSKFKSIEDFKTGFNEFIYSKFQPREYIQNNFTDKICAQKYLSILNA
jgi:hypothetical protein